MKVSTILDRIDLGTFALPEFQRGHVWNRDQVRALMDSLYRRHPVGDVGATIASGSYPVGGMLVAPCSMGSLGAIASSLGDNLPARAFYLRPASVGDIVEQIARCAVDLLCVTGPLAGSWRGRARD